MSSFDIICQICYNKYDSDLRIPRILSNCGHTMCSVCILKIIDEAGQSRMVTCPFDKKKFLVKNEDVENFNRNFALLQIIEDQKSAIRDHCQIHKKKKENYCVSERMIICPDCASGPAHQGHEVHNTEELKQRVREKANCAKELVNEVVENGIANLKKIIIAGGDKEKALLSSIEKRFQDYINLVAVRKNELKLEVTKYITKLQTDVEEKYAVFIIEDQQTKEIFKWKEQAEKKLEKWLAPETDGIVPEMLDEKIEVVRNQVRHWISHIQENFDLQGFYKKIDGVGVTYSTDDLAAFVKDFCEIKYNGEYEKAVLANLEEASQNDISLRVGEKGYDATEYAVFMLQDHLNDLSGNKGKKVQIPSSTLALDKLFRKNKITSKGKTGDFEKALLLTEDTAKKSFSFASYFSKPNTRALQDITSLNVVCEKLDNKLIKGFSDSLNSLSALQSLKIQFSNTFSLYDSSNKAIADHFAPSLARLASLTHLEVDLKECSRLKDDGLAALGKSFERLPRVSELILHLPKDGTYTDKGLVELGQGISALKSLKELKVTVPENINVNCGKIGIFCSHIVKSKGLEVLHIDISRIKDFTEADLTQVAQSMNNLLGIKEFWIKLCPKDGPAVKQLTKIISKMNKVSTLGVELHNMKQIASEEILGLSEALEKLPELNKLHLHFAKWRISMDDTFPKIGEHIANIKTLAALSVHLKSCSLLSKTAVQEFCIHLKKIVNLVEFVFKNDKINETAVTQLCYFVASLRKIRRLCIDLTGCSDVKDSSLQVLASSVEQIGMLSHLELTFQDCLNITDKGVLSLLEALASKDEMSLLSIGLLDCSITDKTVVSLSRLINQLEKLKRIRVDFSGNNGITDEGVKKLSSVFVNESDKLNMAGLMLERCEKVGSEGRKALKELKMLLEAKEAMCVKVLYDDNDNFVSKSARSQTKSFVG